MNYSQAIKKATKHATAMKKLAKIASIMLQIIKKKVMAIDMKMLFGSIAIVVVEGNSVGVRMDEWNLYQLLRYLTKGMLVSQAAVTVAVIVQRMMIAGMVGKCNKAITVIKKTQQQPMHCCCCYSHFQQYYSCLAMPQHCQFLNDYYY